MKSIIIWWSAGATSAVATKIALNRYGKENCRIIYFKIKSAHKDNIRFKKDCEKWYDKKIEEWCSSKYSDQFEVIKKTRYVNGAKGARCTKELKRDIRLKVEKEIEFNVQIFGFEHTKKEIDRAKRIPLYCNAIFPLIENKLTKPNCLGILAKNKIDLPIMYKLGYPNNNCIGCVKGGMGYWNKIRIDFPEQFNKMMDLENEVGRSCLKDKNGNRIFLKDLNPNRGNTLNPTIPDCGFFCGDDNDYI